MLLAGLSDSSYRPFSTAPLQATIDIGKSPASALAPSTSPVSALASVKSPILDFSVPTTSFTGSEDCHHDNYDNNDIYNSDIAINISDVYFNNHNIFYNDSNFSYANALTIKTATVPRSD